MKIFCLNSTDTCDQAMGKELSEDEKNTVPWDSNAITPGTPFMDLLATSLRYWVVQKMNTDPGWRKVSSRVFKSGLVLNLYRCK